MPETPATPLDIYAQIISSLGVGFLRLWRAEAAASRLGCALLSFRSAASETVGGHPYEETLSHLHRIPYASYDSLSYIRRISHLVYATTLLDTFLTDTTLFLFLEFPSSIGKNQQVSLESLLAATSRAQILSSTAARRAREISYLSFIARLDYLRQTFGLNIMLEPSVGKALEHYPSLRNAAVHDQGIFELSLNDDGSLQSRQKTCAAHPTHVDGDDISHAATAYAGVALSVADAVMKQVLKQPDHPALRGLEVAAQPFSELETHGSTDANA